MAIVYYWANSEQKVLRVDFIGTWTIAECLKQIAVIERIIYRQRSQISVVADFNKSGGIPDGAALIIKRILRLMSDSCAGIAAINLPPKALALWEVCDRLYPEFRNCFLKADCFDVAVRKLSLHRKSIA
jgi:hypothetical protein